MREKESLSGLLPDELGGVMAEMGQPAWRARQLFGWLHGKRAQSFDTMTDLPAALRAQLEAAYRIDSPSAQQVQTARDGTQKLLVRLGDGNCVETVVMRYHHGVSVCISSQAGCRMGCRFCASSMPGGPGYVRGLSAGEMAGQVYLADAQAGQRVSNIVLMGIGEPLDNFDEVVRFIELISHPEGYGLSRRGITLSTCGVVPGIRRLAALGLPVTLSVSLHAANDDARSRLMPVNEAWPLEVLLAACRDYQSETGRRVSYEYALVRGQNDSEADARQLAALLAGLGGHVNLIAVNPVEGAPFTAADEKHVRGFAQRLQKLGQPATVRRRLGADIDAACGQLRNKNDKGPGDT